MITIITNSVFIFLSLKMRHFSLQSTNLPEIYFNSKSVQTAVRSNYDLYDECESFTKQ